MRTDLAITDLHYEDLVKIFSYLSKTEILRASYVCWKFYISAGDASLWKSVAVIIENHNMFSAFCRFFSETPYLRQLSLKFRCNFKLYKKEATALSVLFLKLKQLHTLNIHDLLFYKDVKLPCTLKRVYGYYADPNYNEKIDSAVKFAFLDKSLDLEHLYLAEPNRVAKKSKKSFSEFGDYVIKKYESSLKNLYLIAFREQWVPLVVKCSNLKELHLNFPPDFSPLLHQDDWKGICHLPHLEVLILGSEIWSQISQALSTCRLEKANHLTIFGSLFINKKDYDIILGSIPKLEIFGLWLPTNVEDLLEFVRDCRTIKHLGLNIDDIVPVQQTFMEKIFCLHQERQFQSICFCQQLTVTMLLKFQFQIPRNFKNCSMFPNRKCSQNYFGIDNNFSSWYQSLDRFKNKLVEYIDQKVKELQT